MEEHLFLEPYGPGAEERLARLIRQIKQSDPLAPVTVVVPTQYAGLALRRSLAASHGLVNVRFMILARLVEYLGAPIMASRGQVPLSPLVHLAAIRVTADRLPPDGPMAPVARHPALHTALRTTFSQLGGLTDNALALVEQADALRTDIVGWYRLTREHLAGYYEREAVTWAAATAIAEGQVAATLRDLGFVGLSRTLWE